MRAAERSPLVMALLLSVLLHGAVVILVPGMILPEPGEPEEELLEFEMREPREALKPPEPEPLKSPEEAPLPEASEGPEVSEAQEEPGAQLPISELDAQKLASTLRSELPTIAARSPKAVWLPTRRTQKITAETIAITPRRQSVEPLPVGPELKRVDNAPVTRGADMSAAKAAARKLLASLGGLSSKVKVPEKAQKQVANDPGSPKVPEIGGEVGTKRTVVRHPPPPSVKIDNPVTVEMEFWVSPVGDVIRAHALRTGEAALDRAAAQYVKGFKFNALDTGEIGQQRGTILVRFSWR